MAQNTDPFPEQSQPDKLHGTTDYSKEKEKYLRDAGKIEDEAGDTDGTKTVIPKMSSTANEEDEEEKNSK